MTYRLLYNGFLHYSDLRVFGGSSCSALSVVRPLSRCCMDVPAVKSA